MVETINGSFVGDLRRMARVGGCIPARFENCIGVVRPWGSGKSLIMTPLIAEGLTNREIANRFCLSERVVKNRLYRMTHNIGADDRLDIVAGVPDTGVHAVVFSV
jgi:DNA-binding CsgD family transcriptional regulator